MAHRNLFSGKHGINASVFYLLMLISFCEFQNISVAMEEMTPEEALTIIKGIEKNIPAIRFTVTWDSDPPVMSEKTILYDLTTGKYRVNEKSVKRWRDGTAPYGASNEQFSFDGTVFYEWSQFIPGAQLPRDNSQSCGIISNNLDDSPLNRNFQEFKNAIGIGLPLMFYDIEGKQIRLGTTGSGYHPHDVFSKYLETWIKFGCVKNIVVISPGILELSMSFTTKVSTVRLIVTYDINKGGYVTSAKYYVTWLDSSPEQEFLLTELTVDTTQSTNGTWVPVTLKKKVMNRDEEILFRYSDVEIISSPSSQDYTIDFPDGTFATDHLTKMAYRVGDPLDKEKAIDEFIRRHGLSGDPFLTKRSNTLRCILLGTGVIIIIGIAVYQMMQKRRMA